MDEHNDSLNPAVNELRFKILINSMSDAVLTVEDNGRISIYNAATLDILNTNTSIEGRLLHSTLNLYDVKKKKINANELLEKAKAPTSSRNFSLKVENSFTNIFLSINPIRSGYGKTQHTSYIVLMRDITKEKSLEEERDEFISVVSHELRTPVAIAEGNISNAQFMASKEKASKPINEALSVAHEQIIFLSDLLNDLSMLSRAERGALGTTLEKVDIKVLLSDLQATYLPDAAKRNIKLEIKTQPKLPKINSSELYIREVLQNFITNALKYSEKGIVTIIAQPAEEGSISVSVKDRGIGMSNHDLKHIFEKFYRSEDYRTRQSSGTGLGLYITGKLIKMLNAKLEVQSKLNEGSTFTVTIPSLSGAPHQEKEDEE